MTTITQVHFLPHAEATVPLKKLLLCYVVSSLFWTSPTASFPPHPEVLSNSSASFLWG